MVITIEEVDELSKRELEIIYDVLF